MYVAKVFTAAATDDVIVEYQCPSCKRRSRATVLALAYGTAEAAYLIGQRSAREEAAQQAAGGLEAAAQLAAGLAGCPSCGMRDAAAVRRARITAAFGTLSSWFGVVCSVIAILAGIMAGAASSFTGTIACVGVALVALAVPLAIGIPSRMRAAQREAAARVTWSA